MNTTAGQLSAQSNQPNGAIPTSEVRGQLNIMELNISDLEGAFETLANKLDPLLPHDEPNNVKMLAGEALPTRSPFGTEFQSYNVRLARVLSAIHNLRNDLHI